ncbi:bifunctional non-homologous end joining protein LigD [Salibacterium salarium]|uniref:DNA ligase D n=1 Tax=Salibacterium salarium TaxID=284579 RepID=UPI0027809EBB|nr:DNA ligase D [Salibacterium salarium]MDQ0300044.1 bifunctional non-homologous end joining protein LigD [Salibacterium salarium]
MKPSRTASLPKEKDWVYELKYDGYRASLHWDGCNACVTSKNGHNLNKQFPEILESVYSHFSSEDSFQLDGELVILENAGKADFYSLQSRHHLRSARKIASFASTRPAAFLAFDCLSFHNQSLTDKTYEERKKVLKDLIKCRNLPLSPEPQAAERIQFLPYKENLDILLRENQLFRSEGIVAKHFHSLYKKERTQDWLKYKTPFTAKCFITTYDPANDYFELGVFEKNEVITIGKCAHGLSDQEKTALIKTMKNNGKWDVSTKVYRLEPSIVVEVSYTSRKDYEWREPRFHTFLLQHTPNLCTIEKLHIADLRLPKGVEITNPEKLLWPNQMVHKYNYLQYVRFIAPFILPLLKDRALTVIRYPHGITEEGFFQKDCPNYAPDYVDTKAFDDNDFIVCNKLETLLWLGNQLALEWHIPFQRHHTEHVDEIVFDLDPPDTSHFPMAIEGALHIKELLTEFKLEAFVKFSGNKGIQIYVPLPENTYSWEDTELITKAVGRIMTDRYSDLFTLERRRNKRNNKLYLDIPQHAEGKTIIAPYSLRGKKDALVACPLFWEELSSSSVKRTLFTMEHVIERVIQYGCPFQAMNGSRNKDAVDQLLDTLKKSPI